MNLTRCDNCRTEIPRGTPAPRVQHRTERATSSLDFSGVDWFDFCSWQCVADFATLRALDPTSTT